MFYRLLLDKDVEITTGFKDVDEKAWYATAVNTLASLGIITGYKNGTFKPNQAITRAEFTAIAVRFAKELKGEHNFKDVSKKFWANDAIATATSYGWLSGYKDGTFRPDNKITRAEVATCINRMLNRAADETYINAHLNDLKQFPDLKKKDWYFYDMVEAINAHDYHRENLIEKWDALVK